MSAIKKHIVNTASKKVVILDLRDCYTHSFPEFIPFCPQLYYFSCFKDFKKIAQA